MTGRIVLPSGADAPPPKPNCRTLWERFEDHHQQNTGLQAVISRPQQEDAANQRSPRPPEAKHTAPVAARATPDSPASEAESPAANRASAELHSAELQGLPQVSKCIGTHTEVVPGVVAQQCTPQRLAHPTGTVIRSPQQISKARRQVPGRCGAALASPEAQRYSNLSKEPSPCAMFVHVPADCIPGRNHRPHPPVYLRTPRRRARRC
jgi:hypothetical protein